MTPASQQDTSSLTNIAGGEPPKRESQPIPSPAPIDSNEMVIFISSPLLQPDKETPIPTIDIEKEVNAIADTLTQVNPSKSLKIVVEVGTAEKLQQVLTNQTTPPIIFHYISQGTELVLEDAHGLATPLTTEKLKNILSPKQKPACQLALLNAPHSQNFAQALETAKVPHILTYSLLDEQAREFAQVFYTGLLKEQNILDCLLDAKKQVNLQNLQLLPKTASHEQPLNLKNGKVTISEWLKGDIPKPKIANFIGRRKELYDIAKSLSEHFCVGLHGLGGMGKTSLAIAVGKWHQERKKYKDGVWYFDLRSTTKINNIRDKINEKLGNIQNKHILLILDDLDSLSSPIGELFYDLQPSKQCQILITSRERLVLGINSCNYEVGGLIKQDATELFKQYIQKNSWQENSSEFQQDLDVVMEYLQGYPLPLKLASAYMQVQKRSLRQLKEQLWEAIAESTRNNEDPKHKTLKICLDISYKVLESLPEQLKTIMYLQVLACFPYGLDEDTAKFVLDKEAVKYFDQLFDYSLLEIQEPLDRRKYLLPNPVQDYIKEKINNEDNSELKLDNLVEKFAYYRILDYYYQNREEIVNRFDWEKANLKFFLQWGSQKEKNYSDRLCRTGRMLAYLEEKIHLIYSNLELLNILTYCLQTARNIQDTYAEAEVLQLLGTVKRKELGLEKAKADFYNALEKYQAYLVGVSELPKLAEVKLRIGYCQEMLEQLETAQAIYQETLIIYQQFNDSKNISKTEKLIRRVKNKISFRKSNIKYFSFRMINLDYQGNLVHKKIARAFCFMEELPEGINLQMVAIPAGKFMMGAATGEEDHYKWELPQHEVTVEPFFLGRYPVTQAQWRVIATLPQEAIALNPKPSYFQGEQLPVESITWQQMIEFCARLSRYTGKNYRLPSEAEWEYACRAGTQTPFHFGQNISTEVANYNGDYVYRQGQNGQYWQKTTEVGAFRVANAFGLSDMHGNVWERCLDPWHENYEGAPEDGRVWDESSNDNRYQNILNNINVLINDNRTHVLRGGSWIDYPRYCRSAFRDLDDDRVLRDDDDIVGFRLVCPPQD